jgi:hypothetical protein
MHSLSYSFEELPTITTPDGFEAGEVNGTAEIRFTDDGEFFIKEICLDGSRRRISIIGQFIGFDRQPVSLERTSWLYMAIHDHLENGRFRQFVENEISKALEDAGVMRRDVNAEHRLTMRELV